MRVFSVYDSKAECSVAQFFADTRGLALRSFIDNCQDGKSVYGKHPGDFSLFEVGEFDVRSQLIKGHDAAVNLGSALQYVHQEGNGNGESS